MSCLSCIVITFHYIHDCQCRSTCDRISTEGSTDRSRRCCIHNFCSRCDCRDWKSCSEGFRCCNNIRCCAFLCPVLGCKIFSCSAVSTLNFISYHQNSIVITDLTDCFHPLDRCRDESTFALEWLHDHTCDLRCRCSLIKDPVQLINIILNGFFLCISLRCTVEIRIRCTIDACRERSHSYSIHLLGCQCHRKIGSSMKCSCEADNSASLCKCLRNLNCILITLCSGVCKICFLHISFAWHDFI